VPRAPLINFQINKKPESEARVICVFNFNLPLRGGGCGALNKIDLLAEEAITISPS
jgi:hypothetical protein